MELKSLEVEGDYYETVEVTCDPQNGPEQVTLSVNADSVNEITYVWTDVMGEVIDTADGSSYTFTPSRSFEEYYCEISDGNETFNKCFTILLNHFEVINVDSDDPGAPIYVFAEYGQPATLEANISADDESRLHYIWSVGTYEDDDYVYEQVASGDGLSTYETEAVTGPVKYACHVVDQYGNEASINYYVCVENNFKAYVITDPDNIDVNNRLAEFEGIYGVPYTLKVGVQAEDMTGITYKWSFNGEVIDGATSNEYSFVKEEGERDKYVCTVTDKYGTEIDCQFYFDTTIYPQLEARWGETIDLDPGESTTLTPEFYTNVEKWLSYTWYYNDEIIPGETAKTLDLDGTALAGTYKVVATLYDLSAETEFEVRRVNHLRVRAKESTRIKVPAEASADLEVVATADDTEGIAYQWYIAGEDDVYAPITGATSSKYTVPSVTSASRYYCEVTDKYNNRDSVYFDVRVDNNLTLRIPGESANSRSADIYTAPGQTARLEVVASAYDTTQLSYSWYRSDTNERVTTSSGVFELEVSNYTDVYVTVTDQYDNEETANFYIYIDSGLKVDPEAYTLDNEKLPVEKDGDRPYGYDYNVYIPAGEGIILKPNATVNPGCGDIEYSWEWYDVSSGDHYSSEAQLVIDECVEPKGYTCTISDDYGNSSTIIFYVYIDNHLEVHPGGAPGSDTEYIYAAPGSEVTLTAVVTALDYENMDYSWYCQEGDAELSVNENTATLTVNGSCEVSCWVTDKYNNSKKIVFCVYPENHLLVYPENPQESWDGSYSTYKYIDAEPGEELDLRVFVSADNMDSISYHWGKNIRGTNNWGEYEYAVADIPEETEATYHIIADQSTIYYCNVSDGYGSSKTITFDVSVSGLIAYPEGATEIDGMPSNRIAITAVPGGTKTLRVITVAPENETLTYKWTHGPLNDSGWWAFDPDKDSTTNELTIDLDTAQRYLCVVSDTHGNQSLVYFYVNVGGVRLTSNLDTPVVLVGDNRYEVKVPVKVGEEKTLQAILVGSDASGVTFTWIDDDHNTIKSATENSYTCTGGESNSYTCEVIDANGVLSKLTFILETDNELTAKCAIVNANGTTETYETAEKVINANVGETVTFAMDVNCIDDKDLKYEWVDNLGRKIGNAAACSVTAEENATYTGRVVDGYGNEAIVVFHVLTDEASLENAQITLSQTHYPFDGMAKKPVVTVVLGGTTLTAGRDYTVSYANNVDPGVATVTVKGRTVAGTRTVTFTIGKLVQTPVADVDEITVAVGYAKAFNVNGCHTPISTSGVNSAIATATVSEQTVSVKGLKIGTYELTLNAAGNDAYDPATVTSKSGNATITINVVPVKTGSLSAVNADKGIKITWKKVAGATNYVIKRQAGAGEWKTIKTVGNTATYTDTYGNTNGAKYTYRVYAQTKLSTGKVLTSYLYRAIECYKVAQPKISSVTNSASKKMTVKWAKNAKANGYQVHYSLKSNFSGAIKWDSKKNSIVSHVFGGLTKGKKYYVRMRTYKKVGTKYYYSTWSPTKTVTIKK